MFESKWEEQQEDGENGIMWNFIKFYYLLINGGRVWTELIWIKQEVTSRVSTRMRLLAPQADFCSMELL
jgi:hypothetical protein